MLENTIRIHDKPVKVTVSDRGARELRKRGHPLFAEMELYFSCLLRFRVNFHDSAGNSEPVTVNTNLAVSFRPIMTKHCGIDYEGDEPPTTDFPIINAKPFVPRWLTIDYRSGKWVGEFGYT